MLLPWLLCPDEDALEQGTRRTEPTKTNGMAPTTWSMDKRTRHYRKIAPFNPALAETSLAVMGTVAYYAHIPFRAVTRYVTIDWKQLDMALYLQAADTTVSVLNYRILADRHRALVKWFFNDPVDAVELMGLGD